MATSGEEAVVTTNIGFLVFSLDQRLSEWVGFGERETGVGLPGSCRGKLELPTEHQEF